MGFIDVLRGGLDVAGGIRRAKSQADEQDATQSFGLLMHLRALQDQAQARAVQEQLQRAQAAHYGVLDDTLRHPAPHYITNDEGTFGVDRSGVAAPVTDQSGKPIKGKTPPSATNVYLPSVDPTTGKTTYTVVPNRGPVKPENTGIVKPPTSAGQGGELNAARLETARNQAAEANRVMTAFEDEVLSGKRRISATGSAAAKAALRGGAVTGTLAETGLNELDPELANYIRASKQLATAERLISPRGGSNYLMTAEAMLSAGGAHASAAQIQQARKYREALINGIQSHNTAPAAPSAATTAPAPDLNADPTAAGASSGASPFADLIPTKKKP